MKKILLIIVLLLAALPMRGVFAYPGGLLNGVLLDTKTPSGSSATYHTSYWTDGNISTFNGLVTNGGYMDYSFDSPKDIKSYKLYTSSQSNTTYGSISIVLYNGSNILSSVAVTKIDGTEVNLGINNVTKIRVINNHASNTNGIAEFDVFEALTPSPSPVDYSGGLLDGVALDGHLQMTDNKDSTSYTMAPYQGLEYVLPSVSTVKGTIANYTSTGTGSLLVLYYDAAGVSITSTALTGDGVRKNTSDIVGVKKIVIFASGANFTPTVKEVNVYGEMIAATPTPTTAPTTTPTIAPTVAPTATPTPAPTVPPKPPDKPQLNVITTTKKATLSWQDVKANKYKVYRDSTQLMELPGTQLQYVDTDMIEGKKYAYKVKALNSIGDADSNEVIIGLDSMKPDFGDVKVPFDVPEGLMAAVGFMGIYSGWILIGIAVLLMPVFVMVIYWLLRRSSKSVPGVALTKK